MADSDSHTKWIGIIVGLIILFLTWVSNSVINLHEQVDEKADKTDISDRWTGKQQIEYRMNVQNQMDSLHEEVDRLRDNTHIKKHLLED